MQQKPRGEGRKGKTVFSYSEWSHFLLVPYALGMNYPAGLSLASGLSHRLSPLLEISHPHFPTHATLSFNISTSMQQPSSTPQTR